MFGKRQYKKRSFLNNLIFLILFFSFIGVGFDTKFVKPFVQGSFFDGGKNLKKINLTISKRF